MEEHKVISLEIDALWDAKTRREIAWEKWYQEKKRERE